MRSPAAAAWVRAFLLEAGLTVVKSAEEADVLLLDDNALSDLGTLRDFVGGVVALGSPVWVGALADLALSGWAALPPDAGPMEVVAGVLAAAAGLAALPTEQAELLQLDTELSSTAFADTSFSDTSDPDSLPDLLGNVHLTPREHEVLELLAAGLSNKRAAKQLGVSEHTIKFHAQALYSKLGVQSRAAAVTRSVQLGLLSV
ncbi:helix-turn-helix transcriptional regulator [Deinococcus psychrotolerans]|uniref:helix-turn-helix transcriptional regulator n=1 Tax=Deinococcus psychrotolerans TaxID=2489213 RepID=UPI001F14DB2E|nr:helix-turn-helix transcriptional regulator [Deinococcus psychrotolerans]